MPSVARISATRIRTSSRSRRPPRSASGATRCGRRARARHAAGRPPSGSAPPRREGCGLGPRRHRDKAAHRALPPSARPRRSRRPRPAGRRRGAVARAGVGRHPHLVVEPCRGSRPQLEPGPDDRHGMQQRGHGHAELGRMAKPSRSGSPPTSSIAAPILPMRKDSRWSFRAWRKIFSTKIPRDRASGKRRRCSRGDRFRGSEGSGGSRKVQGSG